MLPFFLLVFLFLVCCFQLVVYENILGSLLLYLKVYLIVLVLHLFLYLEVIAFVVCLVFPSHDRDPKNLAERIKAMKNKVKQTREEKIAIAKMQQSQAIN